MLSRPRAGEAVSAALLGATELGLATCPLSQPLEIGDTRRVIRDSILGGAAVPQLIIRLGWAATTGGPLPLTPRREVDDVIERLGTWPFPVVSTVDNDDRAGSTQGPKSPQVPAVEKDERFVTRDLGLQKWRSHRSTLVADQPRRRQ